MGLEGVTAVRRQGDRFTVRCASGGPDGDALVEAVARLVVLAPARRRLARHLRGGAGAAGAQRAP